METISNIGIGDIVMSIIVIGLGVIFLILVLRDFKRMDEIKRNYLESQQKLDDIIKHFEKTLKDFEEKLKNPGEKKTTNESLTELQRIHLETMKELVEPGGALITLLNRGLYQERLLQDLNDLVQGTLYGLPHSQEKPETLLEAFVMLHLDILFSDVKTLDPAKATERIAAWDPAFKARMEQDHDLILSFNQALGMEFVGDLVETAMDRLLREKVVFSQKDYNNAVELMEGNTNTLSFRPMHTRDDLMSIVKRAGERKKKTTT